MQEPYKNPIHACFRLDIKFPITVRSDGDLFQLWQSLSYRIMRQSDDLLTHTRRIRLCQQPVLNDRLAGALADLEHVLDGRGLPLLQRLRTESLRAVGNTARLPGLHFEDRDGNAIAKGRVLPTMTQLLQVSANTGSQRTTP